jgi:RNA-splicing ligase RtcB
MRLVRSTIRVKEFDQTRWNLVANSLRARKGLLGDLGGGNHFLDALAPYGDGPVYFLIHTGSRNESGHVDALIEDPDAFDEAFDRVVEWASENRATIHRQLDSVFGETDLVLDLPHNTYKKCQDGGVIIRKGSVRLMPGEVSVLPSHMSGDVVLIRGGAKVNEVSMSHGTGRRMSRADSKAIADAYDFDKLRKSIAIPDGVEDSSLRTDGPFAYRDLDECLGLISEYIEVVERFGVVGYMGHLG